MKRFARIMLFGGLLACASTSVQADLIPVLLGPPVAEGGFYRFTYKVDVTVDQRVETGDYFTIYDFEGGQAGSVLMPDGWDFSTANLGQTPALVNPDDDPLVRNLTFTRTGGTVIGPSDLGLFSALSAFGGVIPDDFAGLATRNGGLADGTKLANVGQVGTPTAAPEPSSFALVGLVATGVLIGVARRRRARTT